MNTRISNEHIETIVIGGGQAGLSVGYHLQRLGRPFLILDGNERVGDSWRNRWDSLRLFTPARFAGLDGMKMPVPRNAFITKDQMADYLEAYAKKFDLPVRSGVRVDRLARDGDVFEVCAGHRRFTADNVVVAMGNAQSPKVPSFATELDPAIRQMHSIEYRNPSQLQDGPVLLVGAGNSGAEIAKELSSHHATWLSGHNVGQVPFDLGGLLGRAFLTRLVARVVFHRILTIRTPIGRRFKAKKQFAASPLVRVKKKHLDALGVQRVPRTVGVRDGRPLLEDGRTLDVKNVVWCTGYHPGFSWIDLPVMGEREPRHHRGVVESEPGLYFVGLLFQYSLSSEMIHGVGRDARYIAGQVAARSKAGERVA